MQRLPYLFVAPSALGGRGVFTGESLPAGSIIEICPVIVLPPEDLPVIHRTRLHDYYFLWGEEESSCAIALGFGSLYNHSFDPNACYAVDWEAHSLEIHTLRNIEAGEEILVNYNGDPEDQTPVWFSNLDAGQGQMQQQVFF